MDRRLLAIVALVALLLLWPGSRAQAATTPVPGNLTGRTAGSPTAVELRWSAPSASVDGYRVQIINESSHWWGAVRLLPTGTTSTTYRGLEPGATYRFTVAAVLGDAPGPKLSLRYSTPGPYRPTRVASLAGAHTIISIAADGSTSDVFDLGYDNYLSQLAVDRGGNSYVSVDQTRQVTRVSAAGDAPRVVATGASAPLSIGTADNGELDVKEGGVVSRVDLFGVRTEIGRAPSWSIASFLTVDGAGNVRLVYNSVNRVVHVITIPRDGSTPIDRSIAHARPEQDGAVIVRVLGDRQGGLFVEERVPDADVPFVSRIDPDASRAVLLSTRPAYYGYAVDQSGRFYLAQNVGWCSQRSEYANTCVPDRTVREILRFPAGGGTPTTIPVTGLSTSVAEGRIEIAVDSAGSIWAAKIHDKAELLRYPAAGGAPTALLPRYLVALQSN